MVYKKPQYGELANTKISDSRRAVLSTHSRGGYTLAQKVEVEEGKGRSVSIFMKGALHLQSIDELYALRDMLNMAIYQEENK